MRSAKYRGPECLVCRYPGGSIDMVLGDAYIDTNRLNLAHFQCDAERHKPQGIKPFPVVSPLQISEILFGSAPMLLPPNLPF
jgi:hypothetical protein